MGEEVEKEHFRKQDFSAFERHLREETTLLATLFDDRAFADCGHVAGLELEAWLVDRTLAPYPANERFLAEVNDPLVVPELARFNFEVNGRPRAVGGATLRELHRDLASTWRLCEERAAACDGAAMMIGILPTVGDDDLTLANMSARTRFRALNEQIMRLRRGEPVRLEIHGREDLRLEQRDVMLESAATSLQIHLQTPLDRATRTYNAAIVLSAPMTAIGANAPYLFGHDLWDETRITVFEQAIGIRPNRVTFGSGYARESLLECFVENIERHPVILPAELDDPPDRLHHLALHNGTIWRWNRPLVGFGQDGTPHLRIEHRVVSAGPTPTDVIANIALFLGLVTSFAAAETPPESMLSFARARSNFYAAARFGLDARLAWLNGRAVPARDLIAGELLPRARNGLDVLGIDPEDRDLYLGIIEARARSGRNGAAWQRAYLHAHGCAPDTLTAAYLRRQRTDTPVHEWTF